MAFPIAIASPAKSLYSETFIRAQVDNLPTEVHYLYGGFLPSYYGNDQRFLTASLGSRLFRRLKSQVLGKEERNQRKEAIASYLSKHQVRAVLAEYGQTGVEMMDICQRLNLPLVVHFHGYDAYMHDTLAKYKERYQEMFGVAEKIIGVSKHMCEQLKTLGAPEDKVVYNPYGVNTQFEYSDAGQNPPIFLAVGRFVDKKSPHLTLLAFREVLKIIPYAKLVMVGDGPLWGSSKVLAKALGIDKQVDLPGAIPHEEVATYMTTARAFVQHSLVPPSGDSEGTPNTVIEAGGSGLPVISTKHAGIPDVVIHGETGLLCEEGNYIEMSQHMIRIASSPELATYLGRKASERIQTHFTMDRYIQQLWTIIQSVG